MHVINEKAEENTDNNESYNLKSDLILYLESLKKYFPNLKEAPPIKFVKQKIGTLVKFQEQSSSADLPNHNYFDDPLININVRYPVANFIERINPIGEIYEDVIHRSLLTENKCLISGVSITGMPGIGKTQLALYYAQKHRGEYINSYFIDSQNTKNIVESFRTLLKKESKDQSQAAYNHINSLSEKDILLKTQEVVNELPHSLFIFDNFESEAQIKDWLPPNKHDVILTSRTNVGQLLKPTIHLDVFNKNEVTGVIEYICKNLKDENNESAMRLAEKLGWHPLAIGQAVVTIGNTQSIDEYIYKYDKNYDEKKRLLDDQLFSDDPNKRTVFLTFYLALEKIEKENSHIPNIKNILNICAYLYGGNIPKRIFESIFFNVDDVIRITCDRYALMDVNSSKDSLRIHRLLQEVMQIDHLQKGKVSEWFSQTLEILTNNFTYYYDNIETIVPSQQLLPQVEYFIEYYNQQSLKYKYILLKDYDEMNLMILLCALGAYYLHQERNAIAAFKYLNQAEEILNKNLEKYIQSSPTLVMELYNQLSFVYQKQMIDARVDIKENNFDKVKFYCDRVKEIEKIYDWHTAFAYCIMALAEYENKNLNSAEQNYETALRIYEQINIITNQYLRASNRLADIYTENNKISKAEMKFIKVIQDFKNTPQWEKNPYIIRAFESYSKFLKKIGNYLESYEYCLSALEIHRNIYGIFPNKFLEKLKVDIENELARVEKKLNDSSGIKQMDNINLDSVNSELLLRSISSHQEKPQENDGLMVDKPGNNSVNSKSFNQNNNNNYNPTLFVKEKAGSLVSDRSSPLINDRKPSLPSGLS